MKKKFLVILFVFILNYLYADSMIFFNSNIFEMHYAKKSKSVYLILFIKKTSVGPGRHFAIKIKDFCEYKNLQNLIKNSNQIFINYDPNSNVNVYGDKSEPSAKLINSYSFIFK